MTHDEYVHTLDIEAYDAARKAAVASLERSDLNTPERLRTIANRDDGEVVTEAARILLGLEVQT